MILISPTAFKGTLSAAETASAMAAGARSASRGRQVLERPVSDGGPGLIESLERAEGGRCEVHQVTGPLGETVTGRVLRLPDGTVVVETADACGLHLVPERSRDPFAVDTKGVGELVLAASAGIDGGPSATRLVLGLGGSATVDGGAGLARALGWRLLSASGEAIGRGAAGLADLSRILPPERPLRLPPVLALADVENPLLGENGAAAVFGPQKGADAAGVRRLEAGLAALADRLAGDLGVEVRGLAGGGAAGGLGAGVVAFLGARLVPGSAWVLERLRMDALLERATVLVTGEGSFDEQSAMGKITGELLRRAAVQGVPALLVAGRVAGPVPAGVVAVDGGGRILTAESAAEIVARELPRLLRS